MRTGMYMSTCGAIKKVLACSKIEIDWKGWDPQVPGPPARGFANKVAWVVHGCVIIM